MIKRTDDYNVFSDSELNKIANAVKQSESKRLYDIYEDRNEAHVVKAELEIKGFKAEVFNSNGKYHVYSHTPESVTLESAEESGQFKKLAWGRYTFQRESAIGNFDYDDGSIWKLSQDENGNTILVKEVMDEDEDEVIRNSTRVASSTKIAYTNDSNVDTISQMIYENKLNESFLSDVIASQAKQSVFNMLDEKIDTLISNKLDSIDSGDINELKKVISSSLGNQITNKETLDKFISQYLQQQKDEIGSQRRYFR